MTKKYGSIAALEKDEEKLRSRLETAKMNRQHVIKIIKKREKELSSEKAKLARYSKQAVEIYTLIRHGLGREDVKL